MIIMTMSVRERKLRTTVKDIYTDYTPSFHLNSTSRNYPPGIVSPLALSVKEHMRALVGVSSSMKFKDTPPKEISEGLN
jgi:hypothetical protein